MSTRNEYSVDENVKQLIEKIIVEKGWEPVSDVKYSPGTEAGDGFSTGHAAVDISTETENMQLFVKYPLNIKASDDMPIEKVYLNEVYFYQTLYPAYRKFLHENHVEDGFTQVPKCYGASTAGAIALENVKHKGFRLYDRSKPMNEEHIVLVLKTFARFHAASFAFKDQDEKGYEKLMENWDGDLLGDRTKDAPIMRVFSSIIEESLSKLDPVKDKRILERCDAGDLTTSIVEVNRKADEYSIFTQGDCWVNNMMFLYENENTDDPIDIMLVDWQMLRPTSLGKTERYLEMYYEELRREIKRLGSDPDVLYPRSIFRKEWKQNCKYGFATAFLLLKFTLLNPDEIPRMDDIDLRHLEEGERLDIVKKFDNEAEYYRRLRFLAEFMIDNDYV